MDVKDKNNKFNNKVGRLPQYLPFIYCNCVVGYNQYIIFGQFLLYCLLYVPNLSNLKTEFYHACVLVEFAIFVAPLSVIGGVMQVGV